MAISQKRAGAVALTVDGTTFDVAGSCSYTVGPFAERTELVGLSGPQGFKEVQIYGEIKVTVRDAGNLTLLAFNQQTESTVVVQLANGRSVIGTNCFTVETQTLDAEQGTFEVTWKSADIIEIDSES